jgi:hypothetical protein
MGRKRSDDERAIIWQCPVCSRDDSRRGIVVLSTVAAVRGMSKEERE